MNEHQVKEVWAASSPLWRIAWMGGKLTITGDEVLFQPIFRLSRTRRYDISNIDSVIPFGTKPPRIRLKLKNGKDPVFIIPKTRFTPVWSSDVSARDCAVNTMNRYIKNP